MADILTDEQVNYDEKEIIESQYCHFGMGADERIMDYIKTLRHLQLENEHLKLENVNLELERNKTARSLLDALKNNDRLQAENEKLLLQVTHEEQARNAVDKMRQEVQQENSRLQAENERLIVSALVEFFETNGGKNFLTMTVEKEELRYAITIQELNGELSPSEKLNQTEQENARLRSALEQIVKYYDSFDEDAEGFKQAMSDPYAIAQKALSTEGSTEE